MKTLIKTLEFDKIINKLTDCSATALGRELCVKLEPSFGLNTITKLLNQTNEAVSLILRYGTPAFSSVHDIRNTIKRAKINSMLNMEELLNVADTLRGSRLLKKYFEQSEENFPILSEYFNALYTNLNLENEIYRCIDSSEHISDHASSELAKIRTQIKNQEIIIKEKLNSIVRGNTYSKYLQENIVTFRNGRYVIPVKQEYRSNVPGLIHDSSSTGSTVFIEPMAVVEANNKIHELYLLEKVEIEKILLLLSEKVHVVYEELNFLMNNIAKLDFFFAKAKFSIEINGFMPKLNTNKYINLKKAKHPLIDAAKVVPIDVYIGKEFSTLIITGPNTGGKTVTLKTIGLLTLMTYSGLFIPCLESSEIAVFDNIFADIGDEQSIEQNLSTFSSHMVNIISITKNITSNSLVLLDELGSGTDPVEGSALAISILEYLHSKGTCTVASTHYSELKTYALSTEGVKNASCEFDVETLAPTYRLTIGLPGKSNAFAISQKLGLNQEILANAKSFVAHEQVKFEDVISELQKDKQLISKEKEEITRKLSEISELKKELKESKEKVEIYKTKILENARAEATDILLSAEETAKESIKEIKEAKKLKDAEVAKKLDKARNKIKNQLSKTYKKELSSEEEYKPFDVKIGMNVFIPSLNQEASILSLPDSEGNVFVQAGIIKSKINVKKLKPSENDKKTTINNVKISVNTQLKSQEISSDLMLRHMHVEEALYALDKYINDAILANLTTIRIVHGKGEGILRKAVHDYLKNHPNVKSYRLGQYGEGDLGVTIAELK